MQVFTDQAADGSSEEFKHYDGRRFINVWVSGDLGGGTIQIESQTPDGSAFIPLNGGDITEARMFTIEAAPFVGRLTLAGATAPNVNAWVEEDSKTWAETVGAS